MEETQRRLRLLVGPFANELTVVKKTGPAAIWAYWRSQYVFFTHGLYGFWPVCPGQCVVNLWHGMPLKRVWGGLKGSFIPPCQWLLSTSPKFSTVQAETSGFAVERIPSSGLPRNDLLFSHSEAARKFAVKAKQGAQKVLLFLPTYRQSKVGFATSDGRESDSVLGMTQPEIERFRSMLAATQTRVLVKPHPMSVHYGQSDCTDEWIWIVSDAWIHAQEVTLYEVLGQCDALITDISSVYVDYLVLNRPVFFYFPDLAEYRKTRTFQLEPIEDWLGGALCTTVPQLVEELETFASGIDRHAAKRRDVKPVLNAQATPDATSRLFALVGVTSDNSPRPN